MSDETIHIVTGNPEKARETQYALGLILGEWIRHRHPTATIATPVSLDQVTELARKLKYAAPLIHFVAMDVPEQQGHWETIARFKAQVASSLMPNATVVVEDVAFHLAALGPHSAPYIEFLLMDNTPDYLYALAEFGVQRGHPALAEERCTFALARPGDTAADVEIMSVLVRGDVVPPVGQHGFGYDPIFRPHGKLETYAQMGSAKADVSARGCALLQLAARLWPQLDPEAGLSSEQ